MPPLVVAIDGAAGSGKSTLARGLARELGLPYLNTGLMYRALAAAALRSGVSSDDERGLEILTAGLTFMVGGHHSGELEVEGYDPQDLTALQVEETVSAVSRHARVRARMRGLQRALGVSTGAVVEGRDIGTVVFPDAALKIFLTATPRARERRRARERDASRVDVSHALHARDARDAEVNPLVPAPDAIVIDTTELTTEQTLARALSAVRERLP